MGALMADHTKNQPFGRQSYPISGHFRQRGGTIQPIRYAIANLVMHELSPMLVCRVCTNCFLIQWRRSLVCNIPPKLRLPTRAHSNTVPPRIAFVFMLRLYIYVAGMSHPITIKCFCLILVWYFSAGDQCITRELGWSCAAYVHLLKENHCTIKTGQGVIHENLHCIIHVLQKCLVHSYCSTKYSYCDIVIQRKLPRVLWWPFNLSLHFTAKR
jgi:hypothetical protein